MRVATIALASFLAGVALMFGVAEVASASGSGRPDYCERYPALQTAKGSKDRAEKGWNSEKLKESNEAQRRVRIQKHCAPSRKGRRHVRRNIDRARADYQQAVDEAKTPWPDDIRDNPDYEYLNGVRACESPDGRDSPDGKYHGYFQFDLQTWGSVGGSGDPHLASVEEQYWRAQMLLDSRGSSPWPNCG